MKSECNIIRDLLPLCIEDMASPDSAVFVGKHLEKCEDCRREMRRLKDPGLLEQAIPDPAESEALMALQKKIKRRNRILITATTIVTSLVLCALLISLIVYHLPQRRQVTMPVCSADGKVSTLEIDVNYYRRLFSTPWVKGTVTLDGVVYYDSKTAWGKRQKDGSFWDWDWYWGDADSVLPANLRFNKPDNDAIKMFQNALYVWDIGDENAFDRIWFAHLSADTSISVSYIGPASTLEEAQQLAEDLGWNFD